jgi:aspartyl-tRNA synthetase
MKTTKINAVKEFVNQDVQIRGWVDKIRRMKEVMFIVVRDSTGLVQVTIDANNILHNSFGSLKNESAIEIIGLVKENNHVKMGGIEIIPKKFEIFSTPIELLPIDARASLDARLNWRFLDLRSTRNNLIFKIQTAAEFYMREFWRKEGFIEIHSPKLMNSPSESGAELFKVEYFDRTAYLAQSPQFYKQMAMAAGFEKVFEIGPVFRANPSFTSRHDTEFTSVDVEISWIDSHEDVMKFEEEWIKYFVGKIFMEFGEEIEKTFGVTVSVPTTPFPRMTMMEAQKIVKESGYKMEREDDLDPEGERIIHQYVKNKYHHDFIFITDYPISIRPFYHMRQEANPLLTKSFDLLWQGLEITTGAQREHRYDQLLSQVKEKGLTPEVIQYYLDFFKFGCPPHGGFGFGLTRMLMIILGLKNVREVTYLYRGPNRLTP